MYSQERMPVMLMGSFEQSGATGAFATLVANGITYTADIMGSAGNSITIALVAGGTAGSEVVTVSGNAISVQIESAVSTRTQVKTALDNSSAAAALISVSVVSGATAATLQVATPLASGADTAFSSDAKDLAMTQIGTGIYKLSLQDKFYKLLSANFELLLPSVKDREVQIESQDVTDDEDPNMIIRVVAGATPTDLADDEVIFVQLMLRNSGS